MSRKQAEREIAAVERALREGNSPFPLRGSKHKGALRAAADRLGENPMAFRARAGTPDKPGTWHKLFGLRPDWSLYKEPETVEEQVAVERTRITARDLAKELRDTTAKLIEAQNIRAGVLKLIDPPLRPRFDPPRKLPKGGARTVILHLSDWHCGEVVNIDEMEGLNAFNLAIFRNRVSRLANTVKELLTTHWKGEAPEKIILIFGGDMITGEIHDELAKTNDALSAPAVRECAERLAGLVKLLRGIAPIDIYSIPGNHGRLTKKPESKGMAVNSFDTLISQVVEMVINLDGVKGVRFFYPKSGDAVFKVYGLTICAAHGDRIGSRGGQGFIGPIATILRGIAKTRSYYAAQGLIIDYVLVGHFHTTSKLPRGFSNGSLPGPSEYSRDLKADPEPSKQNMIVIHSEKGVIDFQEIQCGDASEGAIYRAKAAA